MADKKVLFDAIKVLITDEDEKEKFSKFKKLINKYITGKSKEITEGWTNEKEFPDNGDTYHKEDDEDVNRMKDGFDIWAFVKQTKHPTTGKNTWALMDGKDKRLVWFKSKPTEELLKSYVEKNREAFNLNKDDGGKWTNEKKFPDNGDLYHQEDDYDVDRMKGRYKDWNKTGIKDIPALKLQESKDEDKDFDIWKYVKKVENPETGKKEWALISKKTGRHLAYHPDGKPDQEWVDEQLRRIKYFKNHS